MTQLSRRFTLVHIQSVQSSLFHDRRQGQREIVDTFAQELRVLFRKAYPPAQMGSEKPKTMGCAVLTNQFISGLQPELKSKQAGQDGSFDQLLARARFEEAKQQELAAEREQKSSSRSEWRSSTKNSSQGLHTRSQDRGHWRDQSHGDTPTRGSLGAPRRQPPRQTGHVWCYMCEAMVHVRWNCPDRVLAGP